jgi:hypothetical protein
MTAVPIALTAEYEEGEWHESCGHFEPEFGWALIMLGTREVARVRLPFHMECDRRDALAGAAASWLQLMWKSGSRAGSQPA